VDGSRPADSPHADRKTHPTHPIVLTPRSLRPSTPTTKRRPSRRPGGARGQKRHGRDVFCCPLGGVVVIACAP
jgi:hypothetical protein